MEVPLSLTPVKQKKEDTKLKWVWNKGGHLSMGFLLIKDQAGESYVGKAEKCVYTFSTIPEQIPEEAWLANRIISRLSEELAKQGSKLLWTRVYRDTSPTWTTDYKVEVWASASPLWWSLIIVGAMAVLALLISWKIIETVMDIDWGEIPGPVQIGGAAGAIAIGLIALLLLTGRPQRA